MRVAGTQATGAFLIGLLVLVAAPARSQEPANTPSLGEVARQLKAERKKEKQKPVAVFTNDNLPSKNSVGIGTPKVTGGTKGKEPHAGTGLPAGGAPGEHGEQYFRSEADKIRARMDLHRRQLAVLQQQLGLGKMQYYPDPQKTLEQESTPAFQSDVVKLRSKIADTRKEMDNDQKAMDELQEALRREGGDPGWIRQ